MFSELLHYNPSAKSPIQLFVGDRRQCVLQRIRCLLDEKKYNKMCVSTETESGGGFKPLVSRIKYKYTR